MIKPIIATPALVAAFFMPTAWAGPPEGMVRQMIPFPAMCLPATAEKHHFAALMGALISDYGVFVAMTFSGSPDPNGPRIAIIQNNATGLAGVLVITDEQSCIIVSGEDKQDYVLPPNHPVGEANEDPKT